MTHDDSNTSDADQADVAGSLDDDSAAQTPSVGLDESADAADSAEDDTTDAVSLAKDDTEDAGDADSDADDKGSADADDKGSADADDSESDSGSEDTDEPSHRKPMASLALAVAVAGLIAAVVCLGYFGYTGIRAYTVDSQRAGMRDNAVDAAGQAIINTLSIDPAHLDQWETRIKTSLTGDALSQATDPESKKVLDAAKKSAAEGKATTLTVKIIRSVPTHMNYDDDTVDVVVLAAVTASEAPDQPQPQSSLLTMKEVDGLWKATKIVPLTAIQYAEGASPVTSIPGGQQPGTDTQGGN